MALAQQDFAAERIKKVLLKLADRQNASPAAKEHLARFGWRGEPRLRRLPPCGKDRAVSGRDLPRSAGALP